MMTNMRPSVPTANNAIASASDHESLDALAHWLRGCVHGDVLVPIGAETKAPIVRHRDGSWTWADYDLFRATTPEHMSYGIAAQTLAVVDIDCEAAIAPLCERFPVLNSAIRENTRKGAHFFFSRSPLCETDGYFDSRSPCMRGIDFKTRTSSGTGGIIVVAPSPGKVWVGDAPWLALAGRAPPEIPEDLLRAIAAPRYPPRPVSFKCAGGTVVSRVASRHASRAAYVAVYSRTRDGSADSVGDTFADAPVQDDGDGDGDGCGTSRGHRPAPVTTFQASIVAAAVDALEQNVSVTAFVGVDGSDDNAAAGDALEFLNFICAPAERLETVERATREMLALATIDPIAHTAKCEDLSRDARLVDIGELCRQGCVLRDPAPLVLGDSEVVLAAEAGDHRSANEGYDTPAIVIDPATAVASMSPPCVLEWMRRFPGRLVMAGGFVTGATVVGVDLGSDVDMFTVAHTASEGDAIVNAILLDHRVVEARFTGCALTLTIADYHRPVQIVAFLMPSVEQVVKGFDFDPARVLAVYDPDDTASDQLRVLATRSWVHTARTLTFRVDPEGWSSSSTLRVSKYCAKGFRAYIPALDRTRVSAYLDTFAWRPQRTMAKMTGDIARVREPRARSSLRAFRSQRGRRIAACVGDQIAADPGMGSLFLAEWLVRWSAERQSQEGRWSAHAQLCKAARNARVSDYDSLMAAQGIFGNVVRGVVRVIGWLNAWRGGGHGGGRGGGQGGGRAQSALGTRRVCWRTFAPEKRLRAVHAIECDVVEWCNF